MKGIMILFTKEFNAGARTTEEFINPVIKSVSATIVPLKRFSDGMTSTDVWPSLLKNVGNVGDHFKAKDFLNDKFALWIDLRAEPNNQLPGDGGVVERTHDGVRLEITTNGRNGLTANCDVFVVSDAALFVKDGRVKQYMIEPWYKN